MMLLPFRFLRLKNNYFVLSTSVPYGVSTLQSGNTSPSLTVGSKSTQPSAGGFLMRSLAVWKRALSAQDVNSIYLAGKNTYKAIYRD